MIGDTPVFHAAFDLRSAGSITVGVIAERARRDATGLSFEDLRLLLLLAGSGTARMPDGDHALVPGSLLIRPPRVRHDVHRSGGWRELYVTLPAGAHGLLGELGVPADGCFTLDLTSPAHHRVSALIDAAVTRKDPVRVAIRIAELLQAVVHVPIGTNARASTRERLEPARRLLASIDGQRATVGDAASYAGMRAETFRKAFVRVYGVSPTRYRVESRIAAARDMLSELDVPVAQVAARLGYADQFAFSKQFRSIVGCSPTEFRSGIR
ncbi:MAG: AraC family transcriptional regulator [Spirochaetaceae bacterium]|nr:MAG: AraC family transcriptional regulator [Spirochaetaceae bacterium]